MKIVLAKMHDTAKTVMLTAVQYPINIGYLAAVCRQEGHDVEMWDFCVESFDTEIVEARLRASAPDVLGVSCVTPAIYHGNTLAELAKRLDPDILTVVGGVHVSALPAETLNEFPAFDIGVTMEAEDVLPEILRARASGRFPRDILGTVYRDSAGKPVVMPKRAFPDPNAIPYPDRDGISMDRYKDKHSIRGFSRRFWNIIEVDSSRGCPFSCTFCGVEIAHGKGVRFRTAENVLAEIEHCRRTYGTNFVVFNDSTFTVNSKRAIEIVTELPKLGIEGYLVNSHVNCVDFEMLETLARTGCKKIVYGIESGSDRVLKKVRKNATRARAIEAFARSRKAGIPVVEGTFILGSDIHEDESDFALTESLIGVLKPDILGLGIITPYPGTDQYRELKELGHLDTIPWNNYQIFGETPPPWRIVHFSAQELVRRRNAILKSYYWNVGYIAKKLMRIRTFSELWYYIKMATAFFKIVVRPKN